MSDQLSFKAAFSETLPFTVLRQGTPDHGPPFFCNCTCSNFRTGRKEQFYSIFKRFPNKYIQQDLSSIQFKMVSPCLEKPICSLPHLSEVSQHPQLEVPWTLNIKKGKRRCSPQRRMPWWEAVSVHSCCWGSAPPVASAPAAWGHQTTQQTTSAEIKTWSLPNLTIENNCFQNNNIPNVFWNYFREKKMYSNLSCCAQLKPSFQSANMFFSLNSAYQ